MKHLLSLIPGSLFFSPVPKLTHLQVGRDGGTAGRRGDSLEMTAQKYFCEIDFPLPSYLFFPLSGEGPPIPLSLSLSLSPSVLRGQFSFRGLYCKDLFPPSLSPSPWRHLVERDFGVRSLLCRFGRLSLGPFRVNFGPDSRRRIISKKSITMSPGLQNIAMDARGRSGGAVRTQLHENAELS